MAPILPQSFCVQGCQLLHNNHIARRLLIGLLGALLLAGCASAPQRSPDQERGQSIPSSGERIAASALAQLGRPYRHGGNGPEAFDCSGLVRFTHQTLGIDVPRTAAGQFKAARPVPPGRLAAGDLLFFRIDGREVSHVAIYAGDGRFVHAPQSGRPVETRPVDDPWYRGRLAGAGRLY